MSNTIPHPIAIVGIGAIMPDAPDAATFWQNILNKKYSITETPPDRWRIEDYYDPDPKAPDKTYTKIGGWVRDFSFDWKRFRMPPKVAAAMDQGQQWALTVAADVLADYGYPERPLNTENTATVVGTAMGGELHYLTTERIVFPDYARALADVPEFAGLPAPTRDAIMSGWYDHFDRAIPPITEDSMPGELPNVTSGRIANMLNLRGPNFITDAACASSFAAVEAAVEMLRDHKIDAAVVGGVDRNMGIQSFVKFCKIGALSATGTRPFGQGADGFVMGEGAALFLLKRLEDAEKNGDKIYAVIRGVGGASDGKGKGITAPNPIGQQLAMQRAWENAGLDPATVGLIEAHGTSTRVGDVVEVESMTEVFGGAGRHSIGLGSVKSNIGHLKAGAGAAGLFKAVLALHHKIMPPTLNAQPSNPNIDFDRTPFYLLHEAREWEKKNGVPRRCGVSAYGFGGTNFHLVLEEYVPGLVAEGRKVFAAAKTNGDQRLEIGDSGQQPTANRQSPITNYQSPVSPQPVRGILALGAETPLALQEKLDAALARVEGGWTPPKALPDTAVIQSPERLIIDFGNHEELLDRLHKAQKVMGYDSAQAWQAVEAQGIFRGSGAPRGKIAFMFPGQGSQYVNMGRELVDLFPVVREVFAAADEVMTPILGKPLTEFIFVDPEDSTAVNAATFSLMQTEITQPAMLTMDMAMLKLLEQYGFSPDIVVGHSLGEYAALIAAGAMPFADALEATAARGSEMAHLSLEDNGKMAAVLAPYDVVEATLQRVDGYVVPANINSASQCVIGGESTAVEQAVKLFEEQEYRAMILPVSHAFHTRIVAPAGQPLRQVLDRLDIRPPQMPLVANVTGDFYPTDVTAVKDMLQKQVSSPVQWVKGLETLYAYGVRAFVEVGPKRALRGFAKDVFKERDDVIALMTNHPKTGALPAFNQALCGLYAAGYGGDGYAVDGERYSVSSNQYPVGERDAVAREEEEAGMISPQNGTGTIDLQELSLLVAQQLAQSPTTNLQSPMTDLQSPISNLYDRDQPPPGSVVISGTGLGLPGAEKAVFDPDNARRILQGEQFIDLLPERFRQRMVDKHVTRLVKGADGSGSFAFIDDPSDVVRLAGRPGAFDLAEEYGVPQKLVDALDVTTQLAMAAGLDALREAGIPLVMTYKHASNGSYLPQKWQLPEALRDETGVIFASAFPGGDHFAAELERFFTYQNRMEQLEMLEDLRRQTRDEAVLQEIMRRINELRETLEQEPYVFDRRFIFRILSMGHAQFAEYIGARGPNTQVNAACASTTQAIGLAEDWIRHGRCRRVVVIAADDVTSDTLMEWVGAGFLALGAAATDDRVAEAALPFDKRRHGTILGMGACALVIESEDAVRERGMRGIVEILGTEIRNSAYHGSRLDVKHISQVMESVVASAERRFGLNRYAIAPQMVFMSHETYTPARGGSAAAEVSALRHTFGEAAQEVVVANTKGYTGHPMGVGIEDVIALKILEHGIVPPVPNLKEADPDLGPLNLSRGGRYPVQYALHLSAGFGSQIAFSFTRRIPGGLDRVDNKPLYQRWLDDVSGYDYAELEVVKRNLRVVAKGNPPRRPAPSRWQPGTGPMVRVQGAVASDRVSVGGGQFSVAREIEVVNRVPERMEPTPEPVIGNQSAVISNQSSVIGNRSSEIGEQTAVMDEPITDNRPPITDNGSQITEKILEIVAEQTGYPTDMLELDLDLEADLGIDTVKQAETFLAIREAFDIPRLENLQLRDYPTLGHVIGFVEEMRPDLGGGERSSVSGNQSLVETEPIKDNRPPITDNGSPITEKILEIVAEQTGYPTDMLELDLDLEADLGIDTVKQAETFLAIREAFDIPRLENLQLRDYPTLGHVIGFVREMRPDLVGGERSSVSGNQSLVETEPITDNRPPITDNGSPIADKILEIVAEQTGYPTDMLELDLDLEADLGIDTVKQAETFLAIREAFDIPRLENLQLRDYPTLGHVIGFVEEMRPDLVVGNRSSVIGEQTALEAEPITDNGSPIADKILEIVAEQTGYPTDMLELDLDLEADLGIDTVKQAETFLAIREAFDIPRLENLQLRDYPTLGHVIGFVEEMRPDLVGGERSSVIGEQTALEAEPITDNRLPSTDNLADADLMPRRVPVPVLRPSLDVCQPTGITLDENSRVIVAADKGGVGKALVKRLEKQGVTVLALEPSLGREQLLAQVEGWLVDGRIQGVYWLAALDAEPDITQMSWDEWREANRTRVKNLSVTMRALYDEVSGAGNFLVVGARLGGLHGYGAAGATAPLGGGASGFAKAYGRERPDALVKVVDFPISRKTAAPADALIAETLLDPGVVEVGYWQDGRYSVGLLEQPAVDGRAGLTLNQDTVFLVTGAAGGITSEIVADLAGASGGVFYLLDLTPEPDPADPAIALFRQDKAALQAQLLAETKAAGEKPVAAQKKLAQVERAEAALRAIEAVQAAGGTAVYRQVNLLDDAALADIVAEIGERYGRIDVLIHAGGIEISKGLNQKPPEQFDLVYDVKADGFYSLLHAAKDLPIGATVVFSSVAGRFGNMGQTDYSAANDLLCKISSSMRRWRPETRAIAIDWTAWADIGMATRGSIPKIMEMAGIEMLPAKCGVPTVRRELMAGGFSGEVLVGGRLGLLTEESQETGGLDIEKFNAPQRRGGRGVLVGEVTAAQVYGGWQAETTLDPQAQPFLRDHTLEGTPLLPGVMGTELFAELALAIAPGYKVTAVTEEQFHAPFKFYRMEPQTLYLSATAVPEANGDLRVSTQLRSRREIKSGLQEKLHFSAVVRLSQEAPAAPEAAFAPPEALDVAAEAIYDIYFHGPAYQVLAGAAVAGNQAIGLLADDLPPNMQSADAPEVMAPRLIELCFQTAGVWQLRQQGKMALPLSLGSVTAYRQEREADGRLYAVVQAVAGGEQFEAQVVDENGRVYVTLSGYRTVALPGTVKL